MRRAPRKGRPRLEDRARTIEARKPWLELEMSRRTWYRRQAERRDAALNRFEKLMRKDNWPGDHARTALRDVAADLLHAPDGKAGTRRLAMTPIRGLRAEGDNCRTVDGSSDGRSH